MSDKSDVFPNDMSELMQKCEQTILDINNGFANPECLIIKDLYHPEKGHRQKDFLKKLNVSCNALLHSKNTKKNEFRGLYVFGEVQNDNVVKPVYVGISRSIFRRLYQHTWGTLQNQATLAYLKANKDIEKLKEMQGHIKNYRLVVIPEMNDYDLYFMEVYIAGRLKTEWNSFKTH